MKYFIAQDDSCHWYLIPTENRKDWEEWRGISQEDERAWNVPVFAQEIDGPHLLEFENPVEI